MNRFGVLECVEIKEKDYQGFVVALVSITDPTFVLFFPINKENAKVINFVLDDKNHISADTNVLGLYKTMIDTWRSSDKYLSGIIMDSVYSEEADGDVLMIRLALSDNNGDLENLVYVNFLHGIMLAAIEGVDVIVNDKLIEKMVPEEGNYDKFGKNISQKPDTHFPEDKKLMDIAKKIMSGKTKED